MLYKGRAMPLSQRMASQILVDEGMTHRVLIFGLYGFGIGRSPSKGRLKSAKVH
jgi:hypothetical protein